MRLGTRDLALALSGCLALTALPTPGQGQVLLGYLAGGALSSEKFNIGFDVGMNFSTLTGLGDASRTTSALFGLFADWRFAPNVHLGVSLLPISGRGATDLAPRATGDPAFDSLIANGPMTRSLKTIDVPIVLRWAPKRHSGLRFGVGPQLSFVTSAHDRYQAAGSAGGTGVLEQDIGSRIAGVDAGLAFDVEWRFPMLAIGVRYIQGMTDLGLGAGGAKSYSRVLSGSGCIALGRRPNTQEPQP